MTVYEKILSQFHIPDAWENWTDYRESLTKYLISQTNTYTVPLSRFGFEDMDQLKPTLLVVGAGACNDLDLAMLSSHFSQITLLDSDQTALQSALSNYQFTQNSNVAIKEASLNGITSSHYEDLCDHLLTLCNTLTGTELAKVFPDYACHLLEGYYETVASHSIPLTNHTYDYVWCVGVHSQLQTLFSYIYNVFEQEIGIQTGTYLPDEVGKNRFHEILRKQNDSFIPKLNDALIQAASYQCIFGFEAYRTNEEYEVLPELNATQIEGAYQGLRDIEKRALNRTSQYIFWPFAPANKQYYEMQIETIQK